MGDYLLKIERNAQLWKFRGNFYILCHCCFVYTENILLQRLLSGSLGLIFSDILSLLQ